METASFKTKLGWITVKKKSGIVFSLSFGKTNKKIDLINVIFETAKNTIAATRNPAIRLTSK